MCLFGCDSLFEKGFIYVDNDGIIKKDFNKNATSYTESFINKIIMKKCKYYNEYNKKYFEYHKKIIFK
ncbi:hypothetical protein SDAV_001779 [Spiroplasma phoeniceum P40]|uniref:Uncharacterized protein n=2 Tax=Spiroplasma phoeniceum TaxID=47835 RepID=A0A345DR91_9MOLU|nr:hypothetical protein SDAV_001779 [Spiroplasma phoeniceum P40]